MTNNSLLVTELFTMGIVKNSLLLAEPLISIKLLISIYLNLPNYEFSSGAEVHHNFLLIVLDLTVLREEVMHRNVTWFYILPSAHVWLIERAVI